MVIFSFHFVQQIKAQQLQHEKMMEKLTQRHEAFKQNEVAEMLAFQQLLIKFVLQTRVQLRSLVDAVINCCNSKSNIIPSSHLMESVQYSEDVLRNVAEAQINE
jgi:hypothetical protein